MAHCSSLHRWCLGEKRLITDCLNSSLTIHLLNASWYSVQKLKISEPEQHTERTTSGTSIQPLQQKIWFLRQSPTCRYPFTGSWCTETIYAWMLLNFSFTLKGVAKDPLKRSQRDPKGTFATPHFNMFLYPKEYSILMLEWTEVKKEDVSNTPKLLQAFFNLLFLSTSAFSSEKNNCHYLFSAM